MKLFTIPYAGGFSFTYLKWKRGLEPSIQLVPVELPGRGGRSSEPLCTTIGQMAEHVIAEIGTSPGPFSLFGHSMGAYVLLEAYGRLAASGGPMPEHVIISGMTPPHRYVSKGHHLLDHASFRASMCELGGIPEALAADKEFADMLFRLLRNDIKAVEEYRLPLGRAAFACEVSLFNSESDIAYGSMMEWQQYAQRNCAYYPFQGTHFFINERTTEIVNSMNLILSKESSLIQS
ncbi:thioesterase II family protein [Paenibacillus daejeonensis]|uniref:thioesterase II family protein n=1 Tax=Paenibacillus daejeonensis TaxID=135193 RepID=UPI000381E7C8|nr:alpha/beta fold hydrolase [Paenibacillus daejeonensis]